MEQLTAKDTQHSGEAETQKGRNRYSHGTQSAVKALPQWPCYSSPQVGPRPPTSPMDTCPSSEMTLPVFQQSLSGPCSVSDPPPATDTLLEEGEENPPSSPLGFRSVMSRAESPAVPGQGDSVQRSLCPSFPQVPPGSWMSPKG